MTSDKKLGRILAVKSFGEQHQVTVISPSPPPLNKGAFRQILVRWYFSDHFQILHVHKLELSDGQGICWQKSFVSLKVWNSSTEFEFLWQKASLKYYESAIWFESLVGRNQKFQIASLVSKRRREQKNMTKVGGWGDKSKNSWSEHKIIFN